MRIKFADLWRLDGTVDRGTYALVGLAGFALKHNLDRLVATYVFHRPWELFNYWVPLRDVARITALGHRDVAFLESMVALALPFVWIGVSFTAKRLRSAQLPLPLLLMFFVPFLNLLFFLWLCLVPEHTSPATVGENQRPKVPPFARVLPESALGSAAISLLLTVPAGLGMVLIATKLLTNYGWGLFVALPFTMGFAAALIYTLRQPRSLGACVGVACLSTALLGLALLALAIEGVFCLLMAMPIAVPLAAIGGAFGYLVQKRNWFRESSPALFSALLILVPGVQWIEHTAAPVPTVYAVRSAIDVQASPEKVWRQVVAFSEIPPPTEWMFRAGIAYPIRAEIRGSGPGAERHCVFSTGAFVEPIEVWDEPHRLKFSVESNPAP